MNRNLRPSVYARLSGTLLCAVLVGASLASCGTTPPRAGGLQLEKRGPTCSKRMIVTTRVGRGIRNDYDLIEMTEHLGINIEILHGMSRNSRMIRILGEGSDDVCEEAINQLRLDPRIESINYA